MKKRFAVLLSLCLTLLLSACSSLGGNVHLVEERGVEYVINTEENTIFDDNYTYHYQYSPGKTSYSISITYPNGSTYSLTKSGQTGTNGHSSNYSPVLYADGAILCNILEDILLNEQSSGIRISARKVVLVLFLAAAGIFSFACPHGAWYLSRGWYYKDAEPSDAALAWTRTSGAISILFAIIAVFLPI